MVSRFRQSIVFQSPPTATTGRGQASGSWTDEATRRAEVKQLSGRELERAGQLYSSATWVVRLWYDRGLSLSDDWRINWGTKTLQIGNVKNIDEQNKYWELLCSEVN